jgi:SPOR domain
LAAIPMTPAEANSATAVASPVLGSDYAVQVTSQRSESGAQAAFRALQAKYPNQLRGRQATIRRADLGAGGIYYRALVGPFASAEKAAKLCNGLKAAGGDCVILKN